VRYKGLVSVLRNYQKYNISIILDLEDSAQDLFSKKRTLELKKIGRQGLVYLVEKKLKIKNKIFIRINKIGTAEYKKDLKIIKTAQRKGLKLEGIFLPKVEKFNQINEVYRFFKKKIKMVPIIESEKGIDNLKNILDEDKEKIISHIHYGHFDYCLDQKLWPFPEPYHHEFWAIIEPLLKIIKKYKKKFIQTPFPLIENFSLYWSMVKHIKKQYKIKKIYTSLVNYDENFLQQPKSINNLRLKKMSNQKEYKLIFAKKIYNEYINFKSSKKSFSLSRKRFISPHQYLVAKQILGY